VTVKEKKGNVYARYRAPESMTPPLFAFWAWLVVVMAGAGEGTMMGVGESSEVLEYGKFEWGYVPVVKGVEDAMSGEMERNTASRFERDSERKGKGQQRSTASSSSFYFIYTGCR
jgi:hypothetical protein